MEAETSPRAPASISSPGGLFRLRDATWLLVAYIGVQLLAVAAYGLFLFVRFGPAETRTLITSADGLNRLAVIGGVACSIAVVALLWRIALQQGLTWRGLGFVVPPVRWVWITLFVFLAARAVSTGFAYLAGEGIAEKSLQTMTGVTSSDPRWNAVSVLLFVLVVPVLEELIFRVMFFRALVARLPVLAAATLSVALFVAMHVQYTLAGGAVAVLMTAEVTLLGVALMWLYIKSGSIWPSIAVHVANNAFAFLVLLAVF